MAQKNVWLNLILNGQIGAGFEALSTRLSAMGSTVEQIGSKIRQFEADSVNVYRDYEDNMLAAEFALSAQYKSATKLSHVMSALGDAATKWAEGNIFHTDDVSKAINEAAHAGWSYEQIIEGIPNAMKIAQAGGLSLSEGLDYLIKMMNTTDTSFDRMQVVIDQWAMAANSSATNIYEMGEAFMSMSSTAMFADSTQELFTLLAVLANAGVTGNKAGTLLRNAMMRVVAPTKAAKEAMAALGAEAEELEGWDTTDDMVGELAELGFSAYDAEGNLKPMITILTDLHDALTPFDEQRRYDILSKIFPLRSIAAATAFYNSIEKGNMEEIFNAVGDSAGYAETGVDIMMSGLTGSIERLLSKWEEFKRQVGENLAPSLESLAGILGNILDGINGIDDVTLSGIVGSLTALGAEGPALLLVAGAIRALGALGPAGAVITGLTVALGFFTGAIQKMADQQIQDAFGTMKLDLQDIETYLVNADTTFSTVQANIAAWESALSSAQQTYADTSSQLSEVLLSDVIKGKTLTKGEKDAIDGYVTELYNAVRDSILSAQASDVAFLNTLFGDTTDRETNEVSALAAQIVSGNYNRLYADAYSVGEEIRRKFVEAMVDDELSSEEYAAIMSEVDRLNEIQAQISSQLSSEDYYAQLHRAQRVSFDTAEAFLTDNAQQMAEDLEEVESSYDTLYGRLRSAYEWARESGTVFTDLEGNEITITDENFDSQWSRLEEQIEAKRQRDLESVRSKYQDAGMAMLDALFRGTEGEAAWQFLSDLYKNGGAEFREGQGLDDWLGAKLFRGGNSNFLTGTNADYSQYSGKELRKLAGSFAWLRANNGPFQNLLGMYPDSEQIAWLRDMMANSGTVFTEALGNWMGTEDAQAALAEFDKQASEILGAIFGEKEEFKIELPPLENYWSSDAYAEDMPELEPEELLVEGVPEMSEVDQAISEYEGRSVEVTVKANPSPFWNTMNNIMNTNFRTGGGSNKDVTYAEGGRAVTASIFGEAGPEWAIPEEHSARTAALLDAARRASGFTWGDLISRFGGLNANPNNQSVVLNYAPTINAGNASGVADVLSADKARLMRMMREAMEEQRFRDRVAVYA